MEGSPEGIQGSGGQNFYSYDKERTKIEEQKKRILDKQSPIHEEKKQRESAAETGIGVDPRELAKIEAQKKRIREKAQDDENAKLAGEFSAAAQKMKVDRENQDTQPVDKFKSKLAEAVDEFNKQNPDNDKYKPIDANMVQPEPGVNYDPEPIKPDAMFRRPDKIYAGEAGPVKNKIDFSVYDTLTPAELSSKVLGMENEQEIIEDRLQKMADGENTDMKGYNDLSIRLDALRKASAAN